VAARILERTRYGLAELNPAENPYVHWILTGTHREVLPFALRPENFQRIRAHLASLEWRQQSVEHFLAENPGQRFDRFNLSDIFEYVSESDYHRLLENLLAASNPQARLVYWNMLARRRRPEYLAPRLRPLEDLAQELFRQDKAFFYSGLVIEEVL
jgi:S-adenosylmethionine-diacylglycerol 3-amino-3-carboxypropyl transferase